MHEGVAGDGLGASVFRIATGADIPGLTSLVLGAFDPFGAGPSVRSETMSDRRAEWRPMFIDAARRHGIDPDLLLAVAEVESSFETDAISPAGAQGLMQFMPATAKEMGVDPFEPASAIDGAARYLAREMDRFGRVDLAVAAYNAGAGAVQRHGGIPPFQETQRYVEKVFAAWRTP
jgi:soluble lytic murein transglycosylase-like protein